MQNNTTRSLQSYAHRTLLIRLLLMTMVISLIVGGLNYAYEQQRVQNYVVEEARTTMQLLLFRTRAISEEKNIEPYTAFRQALAERLANPVQRQAGEFIYAGFYTPNLDLIDEYTEQSMPGINSLIDNYVRPERYKPVIDTHHLVNIDSRDNTFIYVVFPVTDLNQQVAAYTHAIFMLSENTASEMQDAVWQSVAITIFIVLATSLLLYPVILRLVKRLSVFSANLLDANLQSISLLGATIAKRDSDTDAHNYRVTIYSVRLAEAVGLDTEMIRSLIKGAFLHDVGKIGIRDNILLKPGKLDEQEFAVMKTHVEHGMDIVERSAWLADARDVVGGHHEKFAGGGYPGGLREHGIPITARIFAIADVFDALTSRRPYKEPLSFEETMSILDEGSGGHFDPDLLVVFRKIAPDLYRNYCGREDEGLHKELDGILQEYFTTDVRSLMY